MGCGSVLLMSIGRLPAGCMETCLKTDNSIGKSAAPVNDKGIEELEYFIRNLPLKVHLKSLKNSWRVTKLILGKLAVIGVLSGDRCEGIRFFSVPGNLVIDVIAEGIETIEKLEKLQMIRCPRRQAYYFAKTASLLKSIPAYL